MNSDQQINIKLTLKTMDKFKYLELPLHVRKLVLTNLKNDPDQLLILIKSDPELFKHENDYFWLSFFDAKCCKVKSIEDQVYSACQSVEYKRECRTSQLAVALAEVGLTQRSDSRICTGWVNGHLNWTLKEVVDMCCRMKWLYEHTNYKKRLNKAIQEAMENWSGGEEDSDGYVEIDEDEIDVEQISKEVQAEVLSKHPIPKILPWLKKKGK